ncbi:mechanosensitive ion channel family protein [Spirochaetota bacterium]
MNIINKFQEFLSHYPPVKTVIYIAGISLLAYALYLISKILVVKLIGYYVKKNDRKWGRIFFEEGVFSRITYIVPGAVIYTFSYLLTPFDVFLKRSASTYIVIVILLLINSVFHVINRIYETYTISKERPLKGYLQIISIIFYVIGIIVIVSVLIGESPLYIISGIGAITAVIMLIFKNTILSFVAGILISTQNMIKRGDRIQMPQYNADGDVVDIALHTITVQNLDKTLVTIPTFKLLDESVLNWKGIFESGGRRIKRALYIDITTVRFLTPEEIDKYKNMPILKDYIEERLSDSNKNGKYDAFDFKLTNIGLFREYAKKFVENNQQINEEMTLIIRNLEPTGKGLPVEIIVFSKSTDWPVYEGIQSDIFDHVLAVLPEFGLRAFQEPTGYDILNLKNT